MLSFAFRKSAERLDVNEMVGGVKYLEGKHCVAAGLLQKPRSQGWLLSGLSVGRAD